MINEVANRLAKYLDHKGMAPYKLEKAIESSTGSISKAIKDNKNIGSSILEKILKECKDLSSEWLLRGSGSMIIDGSPINYENNHKSDGVYKILESAEKSGSITKNQVRILRKQIERADEIENDYFKLLDRVDEISEI